MELVRSGLKAVLTMNRLEDILLNRKWTDFMDRLSLNPVTSELLRSLIALQERGTDII